MKQMDLFKLLLEIKDDEEFQAICKAEDYDKLQQYLINKNILKVEEQADPRGIFWATVAVAGVQVVAIVETAVVSAFTVVYQRTPIVNPILKHTFALIEKISSRSFADNVFDKFKAIESNSICPNQ